MQNPIVRRLLALLLVACGTAAAEGDSRLLVVSAQVKEHVRLRVLSQPSHIDISEDDVRRRYVDVGTVQIEVVSNATRGVDVRFDSMAPEISAANTRSIQNADPRRGPGMHRDLLEVQLRLELAQDARAGRHAWPLRVSMAPR